MFNRDILGSTGIFKSPIYSPTNASLPPPSTNNGGPIPLPNAGSPLAAGGAAPPPGLPPPPPNPSTASGALIPLPSTNSPLANPPAPPPNPNPNPNPTAGYVGAIPVPNTANPLSPLSAGGADPLSIPSPSAAGTNPLQNSILNPLQSSVLNPIPTPNPNPNPNPYSPSANYQLPASMGTTTTTTTNPYGTNPYGATTASPLPPGVTPYGTAAPTYQTGPTPTPDPYGQYPQNTATTTAPAAPPTAPTPEVHRPKIMPLSLWQQLEREALQRVPNQEGTRYLEVEEVVRDEVCRLFVQSNYDVRTLLMNITRSLQHIGRYDIGLMRNDNNTAFTVTQSSAFGGREADPTIDEVERRRRILATSIERIHQSGTDGKAEFDKAREEALQAAPSLPTLEAQAQVHATNDPFRKSAYEELMETIHKQKVAKQRDQSPNRMHGVPNSSNGNYLLNRYSGTFPDANYYQNYRYYGVKKPQ